MRSPPLLLRGPATQAQAVAVALLTGVLTSRLTRELEAMGFGAEALRDGRFLLREIVEPPSGLGGYLLRRGGTPVLLQAPHRDTDLHTGRILDLLMAEGEFAAAAWNSVPRSFEVDGRRFDADLAHSTASFFNAFGLAFAEAHPGGLIVQIHGHARERRRSDEGRSAGVIVSSGTHQASPQARAVADCLASQLPGEAVRLFPEEVRELGATTNANGRALRAAGFGGFVHLELSRELRRRLVAEPGLRLQLAACLRPV